MPALDIVEREWRKQRQTAHEDAGKGALIIVGKRYQDKFFSNGASRWLRSHYSLKYRFDRLFIGLNYEDSLKDPNFFKQTFDPMMTRLITFPSVLSMRLIFANTQYAYFNDPVPTIAAINGHCFAGGFVLAQACDYRVMTDGSSRNAWLCMNEVSMSKKSNHHYYHNL